MNVIKALRKVVLTPDGKKFVRGAQSRLAEALNCSRATVGRCFLPDKHGELWKLGAGRVEILEKMLKNNWRPFTLKSGPIRNGKRK